jgi:membrane-associated phospholipid phosphatase
MGGMATSEVVRRRPRLRRAAWLSVFLVVSAFATPRPASAQDLTAPSPQLPPREHFTIDPVVDGVLVAGGLTFSELLSMIISTGELKPGQPGSPDNLLSIDRVAVTQTIDPHAGSLSDIGLYSAYGYAVVDTVLSGVREGRRSALADGILYLESVSLTQAFTYATKIGVRRPRPIDYTMCAPGKPGAGSPGCTDGTDLQLSFFSGHASSTGAVSATATYLAFMRSGPRAARPWITLGVGTLVTAFVSYERVRSGEHFPTDVIMGSLAGAGIGVLVPHFHRRPHFHESEYCAPPVFIGYEPLPNGGGAATMLMRF